MKDNTPESIEIAKRLKQLRESAELSHEKLSEKLLEKYGDTIGKDSLINYECTSARARNACANLGMSAKNLLLLANFYNVSTDYLLGRTGDPARHPCAADELSLSTKAVNNIIEYGAMNSSEEILIGLNSLLECKSFYQVAMKLGYLRHWIACEEKRISNRLNNEYDPNGEDSGLSPDAYSEISDMDLQNTLLSELLDNHPELQDHVKLLIGRSAADAQINEINTLFDFLIRKISGYYDLIPE